VSRQVTFTLTIKQARAMSHALDNSLFSHDDAMAVFADEKRDVAAVYQAQKKLNDAIRLACRYTTTPPNREDSR
jgi:hypothetical protein